MQLPPVRCKLDFSIESETITEVREENEGFNALKDHDGLSNQNTSSSSRAHNENQICNRYSTENVDCGFISLITNWYHLKS